MTDIRRGPSIPDVSNPFQAFQDLMPFRVQDILLVSSLYDSFTLPEYGRLNELIAGEFLELSLPHMPGLTHVSSGAEALALAKTERRFNLIITTLRAADMDATELARHVKQAGLDIPVVAMAYDNDERKDFERDHDLSELDGLFLWQGNANVYPAEVERVLAQHPAVGECGVFGLPHPVWGEEVTAAVGLRPGTTAAPEELIEHCRALLGPVKSAKSLTIWTNLPRTAVGKVLRREVRAQTLAGRR